MKTLVLNDTHLGIGRRIGTTPKSQLALEEWMFQKFEECLKIPHDRLIIAGDMYDKRNVPEHVMMRTIQLLQNEDVIILAGNHSLGGNYTDHTLCSEEFIANILGISFEKQPRKIEGNIYLLPHQFNQQAHEEAIQNVPDNCILLAHCNIDSSFAVGDHSLNLSKEEIKILKEKNVRILAAHEHQQRRYMGVVDVIGNQWPSSIADCLGNSTKRCAVIEDGEVTFHETWRAENDYIEIPYTELKHTDHKFVRITGECPTAIYSDVVREIANFRKDSEAFIVASAVKPEVKERETIEQEVDQFNITQLLLEQIDETYIEDVKSCL